MAKKTVYIETSFISYLTNPLSRDLVLAAHQELSKEWWERKRKEFRLFSSVLTHEELSAGNSRLARTRTDLLAEVAFLELRPEVVVLAQTFLLQAAIPEKARTDALHIAVATVHGLDFLLTWNCRHIANAIIQRRIAKIARTFGYEIPYICTPLEMIGE